jgi:transcriptional regulator with XRE-family HTH domain
MPAFDDNPLRLARRTAGIPLTTLAQDLGVNRSTLTAIEEGRTKHPSRALLNKLDAALHLPDNTLVFQLDAWQRARDPRDRLTVHQLEVLRQAPAEVAKYRSFVHWRRELAASPTAFASLIGVDRMKVAEYENGIRVNGMPQTLAHAIIDKLGVSSAYLLELERLEPNDE